MSRVLRVAAWVLLGVAPMLASGASAQALHEYDYAPDRIYEVRAGLGIATQIELDPQEEILDYSTGFSSAWELTRRDNVFYLKPRNVDVDTNMWIRTQRHSYILELKVVATDWTSLSQAKQAGVHYRVRFRYPADTQFTSAVVQAPEASTRLDKSRRYNFEYDFSTRTRHAWLIPANVYDDGRFTYVRMGDVRDMPTGNFPAVYARSARDGEDMVVNTTVEDDTIVVHGTYPVLVIRHGDEVVGLRRSTSR